jgi:hypothetical protein
MSRRTFGLIVIVAVLIVINIVIWWPIITRARPGGEQATPAPLAMTAVPRAATSTPVVTPPPTRQPTAAPSLTPTVAATTAPRLPMLPAASPTPATLTSLDELDKAIQAGQHGVPFRLIFTEQDISNEIDTYLRSSGDIGFSNIRVTLQPGAAVIAGKAHVVAFDVNFKATTTVVMTNGRPRLKVLQIDVLGGLLPGFVKDALIGMIEQQADLPLLADLPVSIASVDLEQGQAVVSGSTL